MTEENCKPNAAYITTDQLLCEWIENPFFYGLFYNDRLIGCIEIIKREDTYEFKQLAVHPEFRHKKYGKQLLDFSCKKAKECGEAKAMVRIINENEQLKSWYKENGFVSTGIKSIPHLPYTVGFMEKNLKD